MVLEHDQSDIAKKCIPVCVQSIYVQCTCKSSHDQSILCVGSACGPEETHIALVEVGILTTGALVIPPSNTSV